MNYSNKSKITELETVAKKVLGQFPLVEDSIRIARRPFFIEFSGTPKSGKTTGATRLDLFLRRSGFRVRTLAERASTCPLRRKDHMFFNVWTACTTLVQMLEALDRDDQIVIVDRGLFDALCWMNWLEKTARLNSEERQIIDNFIFLKRWRELTDIVFILKVNPKESLKREFAGQLTKRLGSIMNENTLKQFNNSLDIIDKEHNRSFRRVIHIDTTSTDPVTTVEKIARITMEKLEEFLEERVLVISKDALVDLNVHSGFIDNPQTLKRFRDIVVNSGEFVDRSIAEKNLDYVQPIALGYLQYKGKYFLLRRSEEDSKNRMHEKYVIWAGGHIRQQDRVNGDAIKTGLMRELREELYINNLPTEELVGLVLDTSNIASSRHIGVVYKFLLNDADVAISMNQKEFKETKGKSMSGKFATPGELESYYSKMEPWTQMLLVQHLKLFKKPLPGQSILF